MKHLRTILAALLLCVTPAAAQTIKTLGYNTTNGQVVVATNKLNFTNDLRLGVGNFLNFGTNIARIWGNSSGSLFFDVGPAAGGLDVGALSVQTNQILVQWPINFGSGSAGGTLTNLGLGATNIVTFGAIQVGSGVSVTPWFGGIGIGWQGTSNRITFDGGGIYFNENNQGLIFSTNNTNGAAITRTNLGLGGSNIVTFAGLTNNGDITINQTATNNGLLFVNRTNSESFLGVANLLASNNTTVGNETLFRVGVAETTNKAAQFGFRATNTNGTGVAVFSLWGNNALCMIGADGSGNAVISSGNPTNEVMTLIVDGATEFARPIRFSTNAASKPSTNAPANTTNVAAWVEFRIGTNSYRAPLYQ